MRNNALNRTLIKLQSPKNQKKVAEGVAKCWSEIIKPRKGVPFVSPKDEKKEPKSPRLKKNPTLDDMINAVKISYEKKYGLCFGKDIVVNDKISDVEIIYQIKGEYLHKLRWSDRLNKYHRLQAPVKIERAYNTLVRSGEKIVYNPKYLK